MASKKKQKGMVFHQDGASTPAAADHPPGRLRTDQGSQDTSVDGGLVGKPNMYPAKEGRLPAGNHPSTSSVQSENLPPESTCKGISVTLDNNSMWNEFFRCKTEMILTKQGSRMFPYCRFRISGLHPCKKYCLVMDIQAVDSSRYKWTGKSWQVAGKAEGHVKSQPFTHPESPSTGQHWMHSPVSFYKLKLTNNTSDQDGNTILHAMHRYLPRLHVVQTEKAAEDIKLNAPSVVTFTFPQTEFMAVTAYQNTQFTQLKVDYNPFAKGLKEDGSSSWSLKPKLNSRKDTTNQPTKPTTTAEQHPVKKSLKSLLANHKPRSSKAAEQNPTSASDLSTAKISGETSCSRPAQKLFSELIREAHVSLQRCNLEQLGLNITPCVTEQINTKTDDLQTQDTKGSLSVQTPPGKKGDNVGTRRKAGRDKQNSKDSPRTDCTRVNSQTPAPRLLDKTCVDFDPECKPEASSAVKLQKRPAPLPLPALALFLKQHSTKSKKAKSKQESPHPLLEVKPQLLAEKFNSPSASACRPSKTGSLKDLSGPIEKQTTDLHSDDAVLVQTGQLVGPLCQDAAESPEPQRATTKHCMESVVVPENLVPEPSLPDATPVLPKSDQTFCARGTSISTISPTCATSSTSPVSSTLLDSTVLTTPDIPQTESTTLPPGSPSMTSGTLLPDPECLPFGFEPLSPASSPESLPPLPVSIALDLVSTPSEPTSKAVPNVEEPQSKDPVEAGSVFKWHTVLPPPEPYIPPSFATFQTTSEPPPLASITQSLMPSQTSSDPLMQTLDTSTSTPPPDPPPSFQENEQSLPFPAELSPLALPLPLSPTFSSLDGDGLSPTPSITDLVHFFSTEDDLGIEVEFSNPEVVTDSCPPPVTAVEPHEHTSSQVPPAPGNKPHKCKKKSQKQKVTKADGGNKANNSSYTSMKPNLEEVEEQLFISFTSKEALELHIGDSSDSVGPTVHPPQLQTSSEDEPQQTTQTTVNENVMQRIVAFEKILLRDMKLMKHRQVIHPVLQEVGLKLNLLDPTLAIDLQYLGVLLPLPPPGLHLEPPAQSQSASAAFVSRTGKTTDVTQIKGWRLKFSPLEAPPRPEGNVPTAADAEVPMHTDWLQPAVMSCPAAGPSSEPPKKNLSAFCSDMLDQYLENEGKLIDERAASFSQPVSEPVAYELPTHSASYVRTLDSVLKKHKAPSPTADLISGFIPPSKRPRLTPKDLKSSRRGERNQNPVKPTRLRPKSEAALTPTPPLHHTVYSPPRTKKNPLKLKSAPDLMMNHVELGPGLMKRKLKPRARSRTLGPSPRGADLLPTSNPLMTRALLKQKDLEDGVMWGGRPKTFITEERASVALTSLFTLMGFVSENPTAPIPVVHRRAPPCLNEFCRLGCVCSSLSHSFSLSHCGRPQCMLGCSCLKQKVVLLKNLEGPDSSPSHHGPGKRKRRKRRMKMAYVLKEADRVSQPAERVRTLWRRDGGGSDPDPVHAPEPAPCCPSAENGGTGSCARVRGFPSLKHKQKQKKRLKNSSERPSGEAPPPPENPPPKPSKRLIIVAECKWASEGDRDHVLMQLCEAMAQDRLNRTFYLHNYLIQPLCQTVDNDDGSRCIQYKVRISRPTADPGPARPGPGRKCMTELTEAEHLSDCHDQGEGPVEEAEPLEDWQREVEDDVEEGPTAHQVHDGKEIDGGSEDKEMVANMALPFLTGISPAGFLSANKRQPGGTDHVIQVNGKLYPLAKIQLGKMGALHPANRLAAYLTGRVGTSRKNQDSAPPTSKPVEVQSSSSSLASSELVKLATTPRQPPPSQPMPAPKPTDPQVLVRPPAKQVLMIQVPGPHGKVQLPVPCPLAPPSIGQKVMLRSASGQTSSVVKLFRRSDGKLVQLIPLTQLRPIPPMSPNAAVRPGSSPSPSVPPAASLPFITSNQLTLTTAVGPAPGSAPLSGLQSFTVSPGSAPFQSGSGLLSQKGACTLTILPSKSRSEAVVVACPESSQPSATLAPAPGAFTPLTPTPTLTPNPSLFSLKSSDGLGAEPGIQTVMAACNKPAPTQDEPDAPKTQSPPTATPLGTEVRQELACDLQDLDIICVDEDTLDQMENESMEPVDSSSEETENSSDFSDGSDNEDKKNQRPRPLLRDHNALERQRRMQMRKLFDGLKTEVGLTDNKTSKVTILQKAVLVIQQLRATEVGLKRRKRSLTKLWNTYLDTLAPPQDEQQVQMLNHRGGGARKRRQADVEVVDLLSESEQTENPCSEDAAVTKATSIWSSSSDDEQNFNTNLQRTLMRMMKDMDVDPENGVNSRFDDAAFGALGSVLSVQTSEKRLLLDKACKEVEVLQSLRENLKNQKQRLKQDRDAYVKQISLHSGKSEQTILRKLHHLSSKQNKLEKLRAANQQSSPGGGGAHIQDSTSVVHPQTSQACPTQEISATHTCPRLVQTNTQSVVSVSKPTLADPVVSHNATVSRDRPRTIPNILSRSKNPQRSAPATVKAETAPPIQTVAPAGVLSLVSTALPGQRVLALGPLVTGQTVLQTTPTPGMTSVTLNIPSLTNQQIHLTSVPHPPPDANVNHLLHLAPPTVLPSHAPVPVSTSPALPDLLPSAPTPPPAVLVVSGGSDLTLDQNQDQDPPPPQSSGRGLDDSSKDSLTSLLNEIVYLNQQPVSTVTEEEEEGGSQEQNHSPDGPWLLHLDEDSEGEEPGTELIGHLSELTQNSNAAALAPPPLLQMRVGGGASDSATPPINNIIALEQDEGGVAWRPMPRLVPLGLRGNQNQV